MKQIKWSISQKGELWKAESGTGIVIWADAKEKLWMWIAGKEYAGDK